MTIKEIKIQLDLGTLTYDMKYNLVDNSNTPKKILAILSTDENWIVRSCVASNSNTPIEVLNILSKDKDKDVRYWAALNPNTPKGQNQ